MYDVLCSTQFQLEIILKSTSTRVLVQTSNFQNPTIERGREIVLVAALPTSLERSVLRLLVESNNSDAAQRWGTMEVTLRLERETVVAI